MITNGVPTKPYSSRASLERFVGVLGVVKKAMGRCTAQSKMLLFRARTIVRDSDTSELARLKKKEERKKNISPILRAPGLVPSRCFLAPLGDLLVMKTLDDEWYVVIKAYKLTVFEIWRDFNVLSYIACPRYPYIRVYRLYDSFDHMSVMMAYLNVNNKQARVSRNIHGAV